MKRSVPLYLILSLSMALTACANKQPQQPAPPIVDTQLSIATIKALYHQQDNAIMPFYNVANNQQFEFSFKSYLGNLSVNDVISVHTDISCTNSSLVNASIAPESYSVGPTTFKIVPPSSGVLSRASNVWGSAPVYYICINYDLNSKTPTKLATPIVVPFTIKSSVSPVNLQVKTSSDGKVSLFWNGVSGASEYKVYNLQKPTSVDTDTRTAQQDAFANHAKYLIGTVKGTTFSDWTADGSNGVLKDGSENVVDENNGLSGDYYVTAVVNGVESNASNVVPSEYFNKKVPLELLQSINGMTYSTVNALPLALKVQLASGDPAYLPVVYQTKGINTQGTKPVKLNFTVQNTAFKGTVTISHATNQDIANLSKSTASLNDIPSMSVLNQTSYTPPLTIPTIISYQGSTGSTGSIGSTGSTGNSNSTQNSKSTQNTSTKSSTNTVPIVTPTQVQQQIVNTEQVVKQANTLTVTDPALIRRYHYTLNANSPLESYLALSLLNGQTDISLAAFPEAQNYVTLSEEFQKVVYQNPLIMGVKSFNYDYKTLTLHVTYYEQADQLKSQEESALSTAEGIYSKVVGVGESQSVQVKARKIYDYLSNAVSYGNQEQSQSTGKQPSTSTTSQAQNSTNQQSQYVYATSYGVLVNKVGIDQGFAEAFKLICDVAGLKSIVVTGEENGISHMWNKLEMNSQWINIDTSETRNKTGIPYMIFGSDDTTLFSENISEDTNFWSSDNVISFASTDTEYDYYYKNNLIVDTVKDYSDKLGQALQSGKQTIVFRMDNRLDSQQLYDATAADLQQYASDKLATSQFNEVGNYLVVSTVEQRSPSSASSTSLSNSTSQTSNSTHQ